MVDSTLHSATASELLHPVDRPVLNRLGYMGPFDVFFAREIGNGPSDCENAGIRTGTEAEVSHGMCE